MALTYHPFDGSLAAAAGLLAVEAACWNESPLTPPGVQALLSEREPTLPQACWLATDNSQTVGFVHAFATHHTAGPIWEVDLLAVHPDWRQRGIGIQLTRHILGSAPRSLALARAFVATHNIASAHVFERAGFTTNGQLHGILIHDVPRPPTLSLPNDVHVAPLNNRTWTVSAAGATMQLKEVHTLLYNGLWGEDLVGEIAALLLDAALAHAAQQGLDELGLVVPRSDATAMDMLRTKGYDDLGDYLMWTCPLPGKQTEERT